MKLLLIFCALMPIDEANPMVSLYGAEIHLLR
jgi:hypothetical protein